MSWSISRVLSRTIIHLVDFSQNPSLQPTRRLSASRTLLSRTFLFGLASNGVYLASSVAKAAVRSYRTISPLPFLAVSFLWHFPSTHVAQALPGIALYEARTFLCVQRLSDQLGVIILSICKFLKFRRIWWSCFF